MRFLATILFALVLATGTATASDIPPTSRITLDTPARSQLIGYTGEALTFSSSTSSANCGTITLREWRVNGGSWVSGTDFTYTVNLASGVYEDTYTLELKTTNSCNLYHTVSETITIRRDQRVYFAKDHLGSVRATVNETGDVISYSDYYPFGLAMPGYSANTANPNDNYKFTGHERDEEAFSVGIDYMNARTYDPVLGRFMQVDPLSEKFPGLSPYNYALNNPIMMIDPDGRAATSCCYGTSIAVSDQKAYERGGNEALYANTQQRAREGRGVLTATAAGASVFVPGPEDVAIGVFAGTKVGQALGRVGSRLTGLFRSGDEVADFAGLSKTGSIDPNQVRFSQNSIKSEFQDGGSIDDLVTGLKNGSIDPSSVPSIRIVEKDGKIFTLDNRRLKAFQEAGVDINYQKVDYNSLSEKELRKFTTENDGVSVKIRGQD